MKQNEFKTVTVYGSFRPAWEEFVSNNYNVTTASAIKEKVNWQVWIEKPGMPIYKADFSTRSE